MKYIPEDLDDCNKLNCCCACHYFKEQYLENDGYKDCPEYQKFHKAEG